MNTREPPTPRGTPVGCNASPPVSDGVACGLSPALHVPSLKGVLRSDHTLSRRPIVNRPRLSPKHPLWWVRTTVPFRGQTTPILSSLPPKRDCGPKRVKDYVVDQKYDLFKILYAVDKTGFLPTPRFRFIRNPLRSLPPPRFGPMYS